MSNLNQSFTNPRSSKFESVYRDKPKRDKLIPLAKIRKYSQLIKSSRRQFVSDCSSKRRRKESSHQQQQQQHHHHHHHHRHHHKNKRGRSSADCVPKKALASTSRQKPHPSTIIATTTTSSNTVASCSSSNNSKFDKAPVTTKAELNKVSTQDQQLLANKSNSNSTLDYEDNRSRSVERKGKTLQLESVRYHSAVNNSVLISKKTSTTKQQQQQQRPFEQRITDSHKSCKNNMTPTSILLLQNHNYIEQHQHQQLHLHHQEVHRHIYNNNIHISQEQEEETSRLDQKQQQHNGANEPILSSSSSSSSPTTTTTTTTSSSLHLTTNVNHQSNSNTSIDRSINNSLINANSCNSNNSNSTLSSSGSSSTSSTSSSLNHQIDTNPSSSYFAGQDINNTAASAHTLLFSQKGILPNESGQIHHHISPTDRSIDDSYKQSISNQILNQHSGYDISINSKNIYNHNSSQTVPLDTNQHSSNLGPINSLTNVKSMNQQHSHQQQQHQLQQQTQQDQHYYNSHYNLMPTTTPKSSSPTSSSSSPSPKNNAMNPNTSQLSNQGANSHSIHLDHLNHHYMNNQTTQQVSQQYSYAGMNHNFAIPNQEQVAYTHQSQQQQNHHHHQQQHQQQQQQYQPQHNQQSIYHHIANGNGNQSVNGIYGNSTNAGHYQGHLQTTTAGHHPTNHHLMANVHQNHMNSTAAACAAAAVVSQTLKTVANQHNQQHHYGHSVNNSFETTQGNLMNMAPQHHQQFHNVNNFNQHHLNTQNANGQHQQQSLPIHHSASIVTRKYQCKMCPQVFMSKAEMKYHNQNHMREAKPYKCLQCPKAFANSSYLSQHMRIHQGVKPYSCDICARKFTQLSHLQQHKRTHTGDKPYKCNYMNCTKQFSQLSNLQSHSRCHQLDKPYKCNSCYKCFHDEQSLLEHIPRHLESKHLKKNLCIFCGSSYQQERGLVKHFQQYHTDKSPTLVAAAIAAGTTGNTNLIASLISTPSNVFVTPANGSNGSSSSSIGSNSSSSIGSAGSISVHNNNSNNLNSVNSVPTNGYRYTGAQI